MNINTIISALVAAGGFGYINLSVAEKQGLVNFKSEANTFLPYMLCWSAVDFSVYLLISYWISFFKLAANLSTGLSLIITMTVVYLCAVSLMAPIHRLGSLLNNCRLGYDGKAKSSPQSPWQHLIENDDIQSVFFFTLEGEPITSGFLEYAVKSDDLRLSADLVPFTESPDERSLTEILAEYGTANSQKQFKVLQHVDVDRKIIIVSVSSLA